MKDGNLEKDLFFQCNILIWQTNKSLKTHNLANYAHVPIQRLKEQTSYAISYIFATNPKYHKIN